MSSPVIAQLFQEIQLIPAAERAIYLQLADALQLLIKNGHLTAGQQLPGTREAAAWLSLNRITVNKAYEELQMQGWLISAIGKGTFVAAQLPTLAPSILKPAGTAHTTAGFSITQKPWLTDAPIYPNTRLHLDDGFPDPQLAPLAELYRAWRSQLTRSSSLYPKFGSYSHPSGPDYYKTALATHLNETRGLKTTPGNILSVRGTVMGIHLVCTGLINAGDVVVSGIPGWRRAEQNFLHAGATHIGIGVDEQGLIVEELEKICRNTRVRMVYVTSHHHYPTTVSLHINRRLALLQLAQEHGFIIFEDDYDYDFHYKHRPLQPLASADENGMVIYCGSFSKSFSPAFRMGYLTAPANVIEHLARVRAMMDRQGDHVLDNAMAELLHTGTIQRYLRKATAAYKERRDVFCKLLSQELSGAVEFAIPEGGMSVWTRFEKSIQPEQLAAKALARGLYMSDGKAHQYPGICPNAVRLGFASSTPQQLEESVLLLKKLL
ncbi:GntR family transcriptional regulator/MocR family aminotransferase [Filimonas zeae]|uniref:Transcriptional regulator n=1 Tax=Filimonas zeae TaxID=1737353 RepID=A0A917MWJ9_9BACT|nr:PLP-dependent aminotransferase family protein [Filimonas zeae]MDR6340060.1 GntR family transcriptional regulator/MocR family aminotransferase [Filimonas zeae]GGH70947.1 transcriptional regulator [Filimonas zeae]